MDANFTPLATSIRGSQLSFSSSSFSCEPHLLPLFLTPSAAPPPCSCAGVLLRPSRPRRPSTPAAPLLHPCRPPRAMLPPRLAPLLKPVDATRAPRCASLRHSWLRRAPLLRLGEPPWSPLLRLSLSHLTSPRPAPAPAHNAPPVHPRADELAYATSPPHLPLAAAHRCSAQAGLAGPRSRRRWLSPPAMAAQPELARHGRLDQGRPPWPPARGRPPWSPWRLLLLAHGRAAQPHLLPTPTAAHAGAGLRPPRAHGLTEEDDVDVGRVGPLESDGSTQPASKEYIPLQGSTQPIQPTNQTRVDVGRTRPNPFRPTNQTHPNAATNWQITNRVLSYPIIHGHAATGLPCLTLTWLTKQNN